MNQRVRAALLFLALAMVAAAFRFPDLAARPMHCDEAVNADRLGTLLEQGRYEYSTVDYHGPTLQYLGLLAARAAGIKRYVDLNETLLRAIPAVVGVLLVGAHYFLIPYIGLLAAALAALFTAVSPAMVYYSRYFIHETLLVFLTFCTILLLLRGKIILAGVFAGLMYATKETFIIPMACMVAAGMLAARPLRPDPGGWLRLKEGGGPIKGVPDGPRRAAKSDEDAGVPHNGIRSFDLVFNRAGVSVPRFLVAALAFLLTAGLFLSSFFKHPRGILDSILAYRNYLARGAGVATLHVHPWHFYLERLLYFHGFTEALLVILAAVGFAIAVRSPGIARFLAIYSVLMAVIYCAIPYKAPWNVLGFLHGMILLAGMAAAWLLRRAPKLAIPLLFLGVAHLGMEARAASFSEAADPRNPWVYAHTGPDVYAIVAKVEALAAVHPAGKAMPVQIVTRENLWPLPWYFRRYPGVRWWNGVSDTALLAPVILATPDMEPALLHRIYEVPPPGQREMYVNMFDRYVELRPRVEVRGYVAKSLWDDMRETP